MTLRPSPYAPLSPIPPGPSPGDPGRPPFSHAVLRGSRLARTLSLVVLGASLYAAHANSTAFPWLTFVSTVPWILLTLEQGRKDALWAFGLSTYLMLLGCTTWLIPVTFGGWLISPLFYLPFYLPLFGLVRKVRRRWPRFPLAALWPVAFTGLEWARVRCCAGEVSFAQLGYGMAGWAKLLQAADLAGVYGLTFIGCAVAGLVGDLLLGGASGEGRNGWLAQAAAVAALLGGAVGYGLVRDTPAHLTQGPVLLAVQPALPHAGDGAAARRNFDFQVARTVRSFRHRRASAVLWPENSVNDVLPMDGRRPVGPYAEGLERLSARLRAPVLADGPTLDRSSGRLHHSAMLFHPDGRCETYRRIALVPWSEYVPFRPFLRRFLPYGEPAYVSLVGALVGRVPEYWPGEAGDVRPFHLTAPGGRALTFGVPICSESGAARVVNLWHRCVRPAGPAGVDFLVNPTSEGLLGPSIHAQMLTICRFRAVEGRVTVVRASNDGISALIDPNGRVRQVLRGEQTGAPTREPGVFYPRVLLDRRRGTLYARQGDWLPALSLLSILLLASFPWAAGLIFRSRSGSGRAPTGAVRL